MIGYKNISEQLLILREPYDTWAPDKSIPTFVAKREGINSQQGHRVKLSNQTWWGYINHIRAMHKDFTFPLLLHQWK